MYFKGIWNEKFDTSVTKDSDCYLLNGSSVKVPFMTSYKKRYIGDFDGYKVLYLPYNQGKDECQFSMYIFLPDAKDGLSTLVEKLASEFELPEHNLPLIKKVAVGEFKIPRFNISFGIETTNTMKELGVILPFSAGGFTKIVDSSFEGENLYVSNIFHKSFIEVNEEGTEVAAFTTYKKKQSTQKEMYTSRRLCS
ncbi:putative Serpin family protein [Medicago truncatula]|uniref:Putative Serpin family protein n=1 Tax=Medicago truncatula TaxID=3880 RepID=A0A396IXM3_MEDTR|nr:serpin-ZXA [Medicago truncatula]RHN70210.1 putative Serpin family protein [Medicago truncatula]